MTGWLVIVERDENREMIKLRFHPEKWLWDELRPTELATLHADSIPDCIYLQHFLFPEVIIIKINIVLMEVSSKLTLWKYGLVMTKLEAWNDLRKLLQEICDH